MAKPPSQRNWRAFCDRLARDPRYRAGADSSRLGRYRSYGQVFLHIDRIVKRYAREVTPVRIGTSVGGEPIWLFRVENGFGSKEEPIRFLVSSLIHSLEFIGVEANLCLFERFLAHRKQNRALHGREIHFVPILNPDGYLAVEADLAEGRFRFHRRNENGVDLNRNFSTFFSRRYPWHRLLRRVYHPGRRPFSEPETDALRRHILENRFDYALSLHSFGGRFLYPYGGTRARSRHAEWYGRLCRAMIDLQPHYAYKMKQMGRQFPLFLARGTETDYLHEAFGTRSIVVEIYHNGARLLDPRRLRNPFALFNPAEPEPEIANLMEPLFLFLSLDRAGRIA